ncbi:MAG: DNA mismatch repair protein MutT [Rhodobacteraceae bacterium]|nr:DNA mismatch repair protein MutT [Paracoccaceae bacterium]
MEFSGAKTAIFLGPDLLVVQRDDIGTIPWPGRWDLPGGGREGDETPETCALRETREEVGLHLSPSDLVWARSYQRPRGTVWFFVAHLPADTRDDIRFGDEGQGWTLMAPGAYLEHPLNIPHFADQLRIYLEQPKAAERLAS